MLKRKTALFLATVLLLMTLTACTKKEEKLDSAYPLKTDVTLTYWVSQSVSQRYFANNNGELPFAKELEKATGVKIEWIHPEDGYPRYTKEITDNPDGIPMATILGKYSNAGFGGPFVQDIRYLEQYADSDIQRAAWDMWMDTDSKKYQIPYVLAKSNNLGEHGRLSRSVDRYAQEMLVKFILGTEPTENFAFIVE